MIERVSGECGFKNVMWWCTAKNTQMCIACSSLDSSCCLSFVIRQETISCLPLDSIPITITIPIILNSVNSDPSFKLATKVWLVILEWN